MNNVNSLFMSVGRLDATTSVKFRPRIEEVKRKGWAMWTSTQKRRGELLEKKEANFTNKSTTYSTSIQHPHTYDHNTTSTVLADNTT
jgi:hypothetical protein